MVTFLDVNLNSHSHSPLHLRFELKWKQNIVLNIFFKTGHCAIRSPMVFLWKFQATLSINYTVTNTHEFVLCLLFGCVNR